MQQSTCSARVYVYDVADIVSVLDQAPPPIDILHGRTTHQCVVDGFFHQALHSFQFLGIRDFCEFDYSASVHRWFNEQQQARTMLWEILGVEDRYAGMQTIVVRRRNTLWLFVLI